MKPSKIYLAAWIAAEKELPAESLALINAHDEQYDLWRKADFASPLPPALVAASDAIEADPLARIPFKLRQQCNQAGHEEWKAEKLAENQLETSRK